MNEKDAKLEEKERDNKILQTEVNTLKNEKIKRLEKIIEQSKNEKEVLLEKIKCLENSSKIQSHDATSILKDCMDAMEEEKKKTAEASIVSDLLFQLNRQFLLKNKNDQYISIFIDIYWFKEDPFTKELEIHDVNSKSFHRTIWKTKRDENYRQKIKSKIEHIEKLYAKSINDNGEKKFSYDFNQEIYDKVVIPRNTRVYSGIKDASKFENDEIFLLHIKNEIEKMQYYNNEAKDILTQLNTLLKK